MVRNLIMGLLLANILLFAWGRWIVAPDADDAWMPEEARESRLELMARPNRLDGISAPGGASCFRLGPFTTVDAAAAVNSRLSARGLAVNRSSELGRIWVGHWVQLNDLPDEEMAGQVVNALVRGGISDAYIFSREPTVDISLGVFRGREGADDVIRLARKLGYTTISADRFRDGTEHWVEIELQADDSSTGPSIGLPDLADLRIGPEQNGQAQIIRIEERSCRPAVVVMRGNDSDDANDSLESRTGDSGSAEPSALPE